MQVEPVPAHSESTWHATEDELPTPGWGMQAVGSVVQKVPMVIEGGAPGSTAKTPLQQYAPLAAQSVFSSHSMLPALQASFDVHRGPEGS